MIISRETLQASVDAWANGERSPAFNDAAQPKAPRRVDMSPANDRQPGILGFNR